MGCENDDDGLVVKPRWRATTRTWWKAASGCVDGAGSGLSGKPEYGGSNRPVRIGGVKIATLIAANYLQVQDQLDS